MLQVIASASRRLRARVRSQVVQGDLPLYILGPKNFPGYASRKGWFFCAKTDNGFVMISKSPVETRDEARNEAKVRFNRTASEYRNPTPRQPRQDRGEKVA